MNGKDTVLLSVSDEDREAALRATVEVRLEDERRLVLTAIETLGDELAEPEATHSWNRAVIYRQAADLLELAAKVSYLGRVRAALDAEAEAAE